MSGTKHRNDFMDDWTIHCGDCLAVMPTLDANSVDSIVTDPPYGLSFMGKNWDRGVPGVAFWVEALRVAKPGAYLLAFGGTRTFHRLAVAIEDAGWELRDTVMWVYGSGFPKSHDVSKAIDREAGAEREVSGRHAGCGIKSGGGSKAMGVASGYAAPAFTGIRRDIPATEAAKQWQGWGTALKPSWEPIIVARKPLDGTVAANVQKWGTGGLNIDGCRVGTEPPSPRNAPKKVIRGGRFHSGAEAEKEMSHFNPTLGRWPANLLHDGSDEVVELLGDAARFFYCAKASKADRDEGCEGLEERVHQSGMGGAMPIDDDGKQRDRFTAVSRNHHPTVKPNALMRYLCRLVTPPGGVALDPFTGSGSTGKAAVGEGFRFIGIELDPAYAEIARNRIQAAVNPPLFQQPA